VVEGPESVGWVMEVGPPGVGSLGWGDADETAGLPRYENLPESIGCCVFERGASKLAASESGTRDYFKSSRMDDHLLH
jgi:hypothetical protein